jgi:hypothetical protein
VNDFDVVRAALKHSRGPVPAEDKALPALDRIEAGLRHQVPGNGGIMDVPCEDYEAYVVAKLKLLRLERDECQEQLAETIYLYETVLAERERYKAALAGLSEEVEMAESMGICLPERAPALIARQALEGTQR